MHLDYLNIPAEGGRVFVVLQGGLFLTLERAQVDGPAVPPNLRDPPPLRLFPRHAQVLRGPDFGRRLNFPIDCDHVLGREVHRLSAQVRRLVCGLSRAQNKEWGGDERLPR